MVGPWSVKCRLAPMLTVAEPVTESLSLSTTVSERVRVTSPSLMVANWSVNGASLGFSAA